MEEPGGEVSYCPDGRTGIEDAADRGFGPDDRVGDLLAGSVDTAFARDVGQVDELLPHPLVVLAAEVAPICRTLQVLILTAILRSKGVFHEQESEPQEEPYGTSCLH